MQGSDSDASAVQILAVGAAVGLGGAGILWGLAKLLAALIPALAVAIATVTATTAAGISAAPWVAPTMATGVAAAGVGTGYFVLVNLVEKAKRDLFTAVLPVISIWAGAIVDLSKELFGPLEAQKALYSILAGGLVLASGMLSERRHPLFKIAAVIVALMPPALFTVLLCVNNRASGVLEELSKLRLLDGTVLVMLTLTSVGTVIWGTAKTGD